MIRGDDICRMSFVALLTSALLASTEAFTARNLMYPGRTDLFELSVIHLNDFHARFVQTGSTSGTCYEGYEDECVGGIARVYTATNQLVNERPNAIFLNAGDNFQGTLWYNVHGWNVTATFMNMLPHDAMTLGNHEFDNRIAGVVPFLEMLTTPVVVTNIDDSEEPDIQGLYTNSTIVERNGTQIGIIGVILSTTNTLASTEKLAFWDEIETVNDEAARLKAQGIEIIIVLSHCGLDVDRELAANCPNVDLIVGGHSHTFLYSGTSPSSDVAEDEYPVVVVQEDTQRTVLIVQAYAYTKYLGNISVWFDADGEVYDWEGNPILLDSSIEEDPDVLAALVPWQVAVDELGDTTVGTTKVRLYKNCRYGECNVGNLITDAMVDAYVGLAENSTYWTYAAIACINAGGIRSTIEDTTGEITYADAVTSQPFENTWDVVELQGSDLLQVLEAGVATSYSDTEFVGIGFLQWSGLKVTFNLSNEAYSRVTELKVRCRECEVPTYEGVDLDEWYRIVVVSFLVTGGDGHTVLATQHRNHEVGTRDIDLYVKYLGKMSPIILGTEGRITLEGKWNG
ncbi:apyrase isoform X2 [Neodiprion lecontei]|uniref:apyrase n=1 Tax=Neodiprion lecontei TaxID=441921 RepID=A0ABM3GR19_NEOLC|nr:apyrase-like isoform X2 [Neodiprion pinetum]XP_046602712.1 apyrase isoform X2 [Neodiprion lecontei]